MAGIVEIARETASAHSMFEARGPVLAMVSGGADSVCLLRLLAGGVFGPLDVSVLHVDHLLRGEQSRLDARFVAELCAQLGVRCEVVEVDVAALAAEGGLNVEDAGRRARYEMADRVLDARCRESGVARDRGVIATAHTFDDRAETVVMRLAQGSGAAGLLTLPYVRERIVRPLLDCGRAAVRDHLVTLGQEWREDATNADITRLRARVRAQVVPLLRDINPRFDQALARTLAVLGDEDELLDGMARGLAAQFSDPVRESAAEDGTRRELRIDRERLMTLSRPMLRRVLRVLIFDAFPDASRLEFDHLEAICDGVGSPGFSRDLPGGLRAAAEYGKLIISQGRARPSRIFDATLTVPGTADLGYAGVISAEPGGPAKPAGGPLSETIDADAVRGPLRVTAPRPGDRMRPLGMSGSRKLQDVFTDEKVPAAQRPMTPVVRDGDAVVWLAGVRLDDRYRVRPGTERTVRLSFSPRETERADS